MKNGRMDIMKKRGLKKFAAGVTLLLALGLLAGCGGEKKEAGSKAQLNVGIVQLVEHSALDAANKGFVDGLAEKGFKENENVAIDRQNAQADQSNLQNIAHRFVNNKVDLICAIATPAAQVMANAKLVASNEKPGGNVTGTSDMNPIKEQVDLLLKIVPDAKTIGTVYCSSEVNSQIQIEIMKKAAAERGVNVMEATVSTVNDIQQAAQSLVGKVDVVYVPTDNVIASSMPTLVSVTDNAGLAVICGEEALVKGGGLATLGIDYYQLGKETGEMAAKILKGEAKPADMAIQTQKQFKTVVNEAGAKRLGITIPQDVLQNAEIVK